MVLSSPSFPTRLLISRYYRLVTLGNDEERDEERQDTVQTFILFYIP